MSSTVMTIKQASFFLADTQAGLASAPDYTCQVTSLAIDAVPKLQTVPATFCGAESQKPASSGWQAVATVLQDWNAVDEATGAPKAGISEFLFDHDTERMWFRVQPNDDNAIGMEGELYIVAGSYLGAAGTPLTAQATFPLVYKPLKIPMVGGGVTPPTTMTVPITLGLTGPGGAAEVGGGPDGGVRVVPTRGGTPVPMASITGVDWGDGSTVLDTTGGFMAHIYNAPATGVSIAVTDTQGTGTSAVFDVV